MQAAVVLCAANVHCPTESMIILIVLIAESLGAKKTRLFIPQKMLRHSTRSAMRTPTLKRMPGMRMNAPSRIPASQASPGLD